MIEIRPYRAGDAEKICKLLTNHTPYRRDIDFWIWINRLIGNRDSIISVATNKDEIVGHYAIVPMSVLTSNSNKLNAGLGIHALINPEYRNQVSIFSISALAYQMATNRGIDFIYGFPNKSYRLIQQKIERWEKVSIFNAYVKRLSKTKQELFFKWVPFDKEDPQNIGRLNNLLDLTLSKSIRVKKPLWYYLTRYLNHPHKLYSCFLIQRNNIDFGFIVTKIYKSDTVNCAHIVDYIVNDTDLFELVLTDFENYFSNFADLSTQWPVSSDFERSLLKLSYEQNGFDTFFGIKFLSERGLSYKTELLEVKNWELMMGDSDAF